MSEVSQSDSPKQKAKISEEDKAEVIRLALAKTMTQKDLCAKYGISVPVLARWLSNYRKEQGITVRTSDKDKSEAIQHVVNSILTCKQAAEKYDVSVATMSSWLASYRKDNGIKSASSRLTDEQKAKMIELAADMSMSQVQIAKEVGTTQVTVSSFFKKEGLNTKYPRSVGRRPKEPREVVNVSDEDKAEAIRLSVSKEMSQAKIAEKYGVSPSTVAYWTREYRKEHNLYAPKAFEVGQKVGHLTILSKEEQDGKKHVRYRCQCDCGNVVVKSSVSLRKAGDNARCCRSCPGPSQD